ncbi:MAG: hypothetical protein AcusKO_04020 [Acuticoccus sp.]
MTASTRGATDTAGEVVAAIASPGKPSARGAWFAGTLVVLYALVAMIPLVWIVATGFKSPPDSIHYPPKVTFQPTLEGYVNLFTTRSRQTSEYIESLGPPDTWYDARAGARAEHGHHRAARALPTATSTPSSSSASGRPSWPSSSARWRPMPSRASRCR